MERRGETSTGRTSLSSSGIGLELACGELDLLAWLEGGHAKVGTGSTPEGIAEVALKGDGGYAISR
jgi:hypothetical protein